MHFLLLFVVLTEGFTTLAMQLVALRSAIPLVGSSIILTSVVIGVILLALAVGYRHGWRLTARLSDVQLVRTLKWMLFGAALYYLLLVFPLQGKLLLDFVRQMPYILALFVFSTLFFFLPVAVASHTMPMITQLTQGTKGFAAGKILFVSTIGSFLGSVLTSTVLFSVFGVAETGYLTAGLLLICHVALAIYQKRFPWAGLIALIGVVMLFVGRPRVQALYMHDSPYQKIEVREDNYSGTVIRSMILNGGWASSIYANTNKSRFGYVRAAEQITDQRQQLSENSDHRKLLVIGAAWFTYPEEMAQRSSIDHIDTVDVDPIVKEVAEKYFQKKLLNQKITFFPESGRGFVRTAIENNAHYDTILVDAYNGTSIPEELVTEEFFRDLIKLSDHIILNMIMDKDLSSAFAQHLWATLQSARSDSVRYKNVSDSDNRKHIANFIVTSRPFVGATRYEKKSAASVYTDDKHSLEIDKAKMLYDN